VPCFPFRVIIQSLVLHLDHQECLQRNYETLDGGTGIQSLMTETRRSLVNSVRKSKMLPDRIIFICKYICGTRLDELTK